MTTKFLYAAGWMRRVLFAGLAISIFSLSSVFPAMLSSGNAAHEDHLSSQVNLRLAFRELLQKKTFLIQRYIVSAHADLPDTGVILQELFASEEEFLKSLGYYLGEAALINIDKISKERISSLVGLTNSFAPGDTERLEKMLSICRERNEKLAAALCTANPGWQKQAILDFFNRQIESVKAHVLARSAGDWRADIMLDERDREEAKNFSDMLANGIIERFPEKFIH